MNYDVEIGWFSVDPSREFFDFGMVSQGLDSIVIALQLFVGEHRMYVLVAGDTHMNASLPDLVTAEGSLIFSIFVARTWNQVMRGEARRRATAQFAAL